MGDWGEDGQGRTGIRAAVASGVLLCGAAGVGVWFTSAGPTPSGSGPAPTEEEARRADEGRRAAEKAGRAVQQQRTEDAARRAAEMRAAAARPPADGTGEPAK